MMKNKIKLTLAVILLISLFGFCYADSMPPQKQNSEVTMIMTCNNCTYCNLTSISYPNSTIFLENLNMTQATTKYIYTLDSLYITQLGDYIWCYECGNEAESSTGCNDFPVTPSGVLQTTSQGIGSAIFLISMLVLTFLFGFMGFKLSESEYLWILGIFFMFLSVLFVVYDVWLGYEFHRNFTGITNSAMPETIFYIFMFLLILGLFVSAALLFVHWRKVFKYVKKEIKLKEEDDVDFEDEDFQ